MDSHSSVNQYDDDGFYTAANTSNTYNNEDYTQDQGYNDTTNYDGNYNYDEQYYDDNGQQYEYTEQQTYDENNYDETGTFDDDWTNDDDYYSKQSQPSQPVHSTTNTTATTKQSRFPKVRSTKSATSSSTTGLTRSGVNVSSRGGISSRDRVSRPQQKRSTFTPRDPIVQQSMHRSRGGMSGNVGNIGDGRSGINGVNAVNNGNISNGFQSLASAGIAAAATSGVLGAVTGNAGLGGGAAGIGANMMGQIGKQYTDQFMKQLPPGVMSLAYYKYYFRVDNEYVLKKLGRLLLPCLKRSVQDWRRKKVDEQSQDPLAPNPKVNSPAFAAYLYQPAVYDLNAPDFYLPLMFVLTYIVIMGFMVGTKSAAEAEGENANSGGQQTTFSPQILVATGSGAFVMMLIEVVLMKIGFYLIGSVATPPYWLDVVCYAGYKILFVVINLVINLIFPNLILYYLVSFGTGGIAALFMIQTLRPYFRDLSECGQIFGNVNEPKKTKMVFLAIVAVTEILFIQWMGRYTTV